MSTRTLMLKWSWRDLKANWVKVGAIALVIAMGTGAYAGLSSQANWRRTSYDTSYSLLSMYDVRVELTTGTYVDRGTLRDAVSAIPHAAWVDAAAERLVLPTQIEVSTADETILVRGELTGADFSGGGPAVNSYHAFTGRLLTEHDAGAPRVMLDRSFATFHGLDDSGTVEIIGGRSLEYVGQATTPEYFAVSPKGEIFMSEATFAGVFTTLETAQALAGFDGSVNDAVITLLPEADRSVVVGEVEQELAALGVGAAVSTRDDNASYQALTKDVENDQRVFNVLAFLLVAGAVVAAYIMIHRLTQQQRREIGIAMALGVEPRRVAIRHLLVSAQIALLGVVLGVVVGLWVGGLLQGVMEDFVPLPVWETGFQTRLFAGVAVLGFLIPFVATAVPVIRAVRVKPVDAIRPLYHKTVPIGRRARKTHKRGNTFTRMPFHNLRRSPWRSSFTTLAVALVIMVLVAFLGLMDSVFGVVDVAEAEMVQDVSDRMVVTLDGFYPMDAPEIAAIQSAGSVESAEATLRLGGEVRGASDEFGVIVEMLDFDEAMWRPSITEGEVGSTPGVVLAREAASDLGVGVGDDVTLRHPLRTGPFTFGLVDTELPVLAIHPYPIRNFVYIDVAHADLMGLAGIVNLVHVDPGAGVTDGSVERELFSLPGVASVQPVSTVVGAIRDQMSQLTGIIQAMTFVVLTLAGLIAFLTASISLDARAREHATMFAFGVRVRTALRMAMTESMAMGAVATFIGIAGGLGILWWMTSQLIATTIPDVGMEVVLNIATVATTVLLGVVAVTIAPMFTVRRMRRMDLPGTLRLME